MKGSPKLTKRTLIHRFCFLLAILALSALGGVFAKVLPITAINWKGIVTGQNPVEILTQGLTPLTGEPFYVLVMGVDRGQGNSTNSKPSFDGRTDTLMVVKFSPEEHSVKILSIPRDTKVDLDDFGTDKINAANVYGGKSLTTSSVEKVMLNSVKIHRYIRINKDALIAVVDALGGVEIDIPKRMFYEDKTQKLYIDLHQGRQVLNSKQAEGFVRFRDEEGDIGRIKRQQQFLKALKQKPVKEPWLILKLSNIVDVIYPYIDTNLSTEEILAIATFYPSIRKQETFDLPGRPSTSRESDISYWISDRKGIANLLKNKFN